MYGATIGKTSIFGVDAATNQACAAGLPEAISAEFLYYLPGVAGKSDYADAGKGGAQPNISSDDRKGMALSCRHANEQTRIVEKLEELLSDLDAGVAELKAAQKKLGQYRQSLLKAAVEGALTADWRAAEKSALAIRRRKPVRSCLSASSPNAAPAGKPNSSPSLRSKAKPRLKPGKRNTPSRCSPIPRVAGTAGGVGVGECRSGGRDFLGKCLIKPSTLLERKCLYHEKHVNVSLGQH